MKTKITFLIIISVFCISNITNAQTAKEIEQKIALLKNQIQELKQEKTLLEVSLTNKNLAKYEASQTLFFSCNKCVYENICFGISDSLSYVTLIIKDGNKKITKFIKEYKGELVSIPQVEGEQFPELIAPNGEQLWIRYRFEL